ncbi:hypothetical protein E2C01_010645 [Portunus trituberculatus]|uniref:Peptidase S1 domain-containing protein n=1 Tax=Portunus trituberculatus TaxID=210409 RepID=A0A5B7D8Z3_PORTR|nr:hypothetical protein [Portunus trituberculatus]
MRGPASLQHSFIKPQSVPLSPVVLSDGTLSRLSPTQVALLSYIATLPLVAGHDPPVTASPRSLASPLILLQQCNGTSFGCFPSSGSVDSLVLNQLLQGLTMPPGASPEFGPEDCTFISRHILLLQWLLKLRNQATLTDNVCLMCIPHQDVSVPASQCVVVGYGVRAFPDSTHNSAYHQTQTVMHNYGANVPCYTVPPPASNRQSHVCLAMKSPPQRLRHSRSTLEPLCVLIQHVNSFFCAPILAV